MNGMRHAMQPHFPRSTTICFHRTFAVLLPLVLLGACDHAKVPDHVHPAFSDPAKRHPIAVVVDRAEVDIPVHADGKRGRAVANMEATRFARNYSKEGRSPLVIAVPARLDRRHESFEQVREIQNALAHEGITSDRVRVRRKTAGQLQDSITLSYDRVAAIGPVCDDWSIDAASNPDFLPWANYGCATQRNLAHMVANPTDLSFPAQESERGSDRRTATRKAFVETPPAPTVAKETTK